MWFSLTGYVFPLCSNEVLGVCVSASACGRRVFKSDSHARWWLPDYHADGKHSKCFLNDCGGIVELVQASRVFSEKSESLSKVFVKDLVVFLSKLSESLRKRPKEHENIL